MNDFKKNSDVYALKIEDMKITLKKVKISSINKGYVKSSSEEGFDLVIVITAMDDNGEYYTDAPSTGYEYFVNKFLLTIPDDYNAGFSFYYKEDLKIVISKLLDEATCAKKELDLYLSTLRDIDRDINLEGYMEWWGSLLPHFSLFLLNVFGPCDIVTLEW